MSGSRVQRFAPIPTWSLESGVVFYQNPASCYQNASSCCAYSASSPEHAGLPGETDTEQTQRARGETVSVQLCRSPTKAGMAQQDARPQIPVWGATCNAC